MPTQLDLINARIAAEEKRLADLQAQRKALTQKNQALANRKQRQRETRQKILLGAFVFDILKKKGIAPAQLEMAGQPFKDYLNRPADRALFDLPD
jgi:hypothetical protein